MTNVLVTDISITAISEEAVVTVSSVGIQGAPGVGGGQTTRIKIPFSWGDATPALIHTYTGTIFAAAIVLQVPFNGVGASLSLGDSGNNGRLISASEVDATAAATYGTSPAHTYASSTQIRLYITPGTGASQGSGFVLLEI